MVDLRPFFATVVTLIAPAAFAAGIGVSPPRLELSAQAGQTLTHSVEIISSESSAQVVDVQVLDWTLLPGGEVSYFEAGSLPYSASDWLTLEADVLNLPASQAVPYRLSLNLPEGLAAGTYNTMVIFRVVSAPDAGEQGAQLVITTAVGLAIYVTVTGEERASADLYDVYVADDVKGLTFIVGNTGNTLVRLGGKVELRDESGRAAYTLDVPELAVLRESEREVTLPFPEDMAAGFYVALTFIEDGHGGVMIGELPFTTK